MIETSTTWKDTSHDCQYCGGIILHRTDFEAGRQVTACYQCKDCGTQWNLLGRILRLGHLKRRPPALNDVTRNQISLPRWLPTAAAVFAIITILFYTGLFAIIARYMLPLAIVGTFAVLIWQLGHHYGWWAAWRRSRNSG